MINTRWLLPLRSLPVGVTPRMKIFINDWLACVIMPSWRPRWEMPLSNRHLLYSGHVKPLFISAVPKANQSLERLKGVLVSSQSVQLGFRTLPAQALSSSAALPKIGQLWAMWPKVKGGKGLHTHTKVCMITLKQGLSPTMALTRTEFSVFRWK